jgi:cysteinyl-tRNA synthetase
MQSPEIQLYNTLGRSKQKFVSITPGEVKLYTCGPTVYDYAHIGNLRYFTFVDTLRRTLEYFGYKVHHVMNITDVGHLSDDGDLGEDKMLRAVARESKKQGKEFTVWDLASFYTTAFRNDVASMNILPPHNLTPATEHIQQMIDMIEKLIEKGYAYVTKSAVYYDVTKFKEYSKLSGQEIDDKLVGVRDEVVVDADKKHPADFRLWQLDQPDHAMQWDSPWGRGFPGWHIECSAMAKAYLGDTIDIHTGGIDHIPVHHTNEIAQSEATTGKEFAKFWMHVNFLRVNNEKMSKSTGNFYILSDLVKKKFPPIVLRYFYLSAHYRTSVNFTLEGLEAVKNAYNNLIDAVKVIKSVVDRDGEKDIELSEAAQEYLNGIEAFFADDLNTPGAIGIVWDMVKSGISSQEKYKILKKVDRVLGLKLTDVETFYSSPVIIQKAKDEAEKLVSLREAAKVQKNWGKADDLRKQVEKLHFTVVDTREGTVILTK